VARETNRLICQDAGVQTFFMEAGVKFPYLLEVKNWIYNAVKRATNKIPIPPNNVNSIYWRKPWFQHTGYQLGVNRGRQSID